MYYLSDVISDWSATQIVMHNSAEPPNFVNNSSSLCHASKSNLWTCTCSLGRKGVGSLDQQYIMYVTKLFLRMINLVHFRKKKNPSPVISWSVVSDFITQIITIAKAIWWFFFGLTWDVLKFFCEVKTCHKT